MDSRIQSGLEIDNRSSRASVVAIESGLEVVQAEKEHANPLPVTLAQVEKEGIVATETLSELPYQKDKTDEAPVAPIRKPLIQRHKWKLVIVAVVILVAAVAGGAAGGVLSNRKPEAFSLQGSSGTSGSLPSFGQDQEFACRSSLCPQAITALTSGGNDLVFALAANRTLLYLQSSNGVWDTAWSDLGGTFFSFPSLVQSEANRIDVFGVQEDRSLYWRRRIDGTWNDRWIPLSGSSWAGSIHASLYVPDSWVVYGAHPNGSLHQWWFWEREWGFLNLAGIVLDTPMAVSANGSQYVFVRGTDDGLYYREFDIPTWIEWTNLGGQINSSPVAVSSDESTLDVFALGRDGLLCWIGYRTEWLDWSCPRSNTTLASIVNVVSTAPGVVHIVALSRKDQVVHTTLVDSKLGHEWQDLGGPLNSAPFINGNTSDVTVFGIGADRGLYSSQWRVDGTRLVVRAPWSFLGGEDLVSLI